MGDAVVGIIGMGDMGRMYARRISDAGWRYVSMSLRRLAKDMTVRGNSLFFHHRSPMMT